MTIQIAGTDVIDQSRNIVTATLKNYSETASALGTLNTNASPGNTLNLSTATVFTGTLLSSGTTTFTFTTGVTSGAASFVLILTNASGTANNTTLAWPGSVVWSGGTVPDWTQNSATIQGRTNIWSFTTLNNGTTWYGNLIQPNIV